MRTWRNPFFFIPAAYLAAGLLPCAMAQNAAPNSVFPDDIEEVVVTARRREGSGGNRNTAASRRDLEWSDQTGMEGFFDDIDGLSTLGGDDQGNDFSIDGLSANLGNVTLNGQGFGEGRGSGGLSAGDLPPDMIRRVDVYKLPSAAMEEGGSAGVVNLQLRNPVTLTGYSAGMRTRLGYTPERGRFDPSASFNSGGPSEGRTFGHMLNANLSQRTREYSSQDVSSWIPGDFESGSAFYPGQLRNNAVRDRQRNAFAGLVLGFRPLESLSVSANLMISRKQRDVVTHSMQQRLEKQRDITALAIDGRIVSELESDDRSRSNLRIAGNTRSDRVDSLSLGLIANWRLESWRVNASLGRGTDTNESDSPTQSASFAANSAFGYHAGAGGSLYPFDSNGFTPLSSFEISRINLSDRKTEDSNAFAGVDAIRLLQGDFLRRFRMGVKIRESSRSKEQSNAKVQLDDGLSLQDFFTGRYRQTPWDESPWPSSDMGLVDDQVQGEAVDWKENLLNAYNMDRQTGAAYLQVDFRRSRDDRLLWAGNAGVRVVSSETRIDGYQQDVETPEAVSVNNDYSDVLPSVLARRRLASRTILTLGAARVMTHPSFNDLAPGLRLNQSDKTGRLGNPELEPFRATLYLAELNWGGNGRRVSGNLSWRDVSSYFALGEESYEYDDDTYLVTRPVNGEAGSILSTSIGLEQNLGRVDKRLQNLDVSFSGVYNKSRSDMKDPYTGKTLPMPGTAEYVVRADLAYGRKTFSGKLSYQWRGESLKASSSKSGLSVWNQPTGNLNLNLGWKLGRDLAFNLDARNLLAEEQRQTTDDAGQVWRYTERDRTLAATLQAKW